jgi:VIT1/CCC1 family predicted Fe2+/Mn2+ transporter
MSMAAGEYVSVSSQSDTERADLAREKQELKQDPASEMEELARIYVRRGLELLLARQVARQLMAKDALGAHARDELGLGGHPKAHAKGDVLGCTCDGSNGRDRRGFRHSRLGHACPCRKLDPLTNEAESDDAAGR